MNAIGGSTIIRVLPGGTSREFGVFVYDAATTGAARSGVGVRFEAVAAAATFPGASNRTAHTVPTDAQGEAWTRVQPIPGGPNVIRVRAIAAGEPTPIEFTVQVDPNAAAPAPDPVAPPPPRGPWTAIAAMVLGGLAVLGLVLALLIGKIGTASGATHAGGGTTVIKTGGPAVDQTARTTAQDANGKADKLGAEVKEFKFTTAEELKNRPTRVEVRSRINTASRATLRAAMLADLEHEDELDRRMLAELGEE